MGLLKKNSFGHNLFLKKWVIRVFGILSYKRFNGINSLNITGSEVLRSLPSHNVLFVSNHQTYYADVAAMLHVMNSSLCGHDNNINNLFSYIWSPKLNIFFVAAKETMKAGALAKTLSYAGAILVERSWRSKGKKITREVKRSDIDNVEKSLEAGWLITFPQGTTTPWKPIRKGTAHIVKNNKPVVVPIVIDGFRRSFDKKGVFLKKRGVNMSITIKEPMKFDYEKETIEDIVLKIAMAIEQDPSFKKA